MTPLLFSSAPDERRYELRKAALLALERGNVAEFDAVCSKGWSPLLHDSSSDNALSRLICDLSRLWPSDPSPNIAAVHRLFVRFPELIWEMSWKSKTRSFSGRSLELDAVWQRTHPELKKILVPCLPAGFFAPSLTYEHIKALALPPSYSNEWRVDAFEFNGFFKSPAWADAIKCPGAPRLSLLLIKAHLCCELANRQASGAHEQAERISACVDALDAVIKPFNTPSAAPSPASISAAYYCLCLDQPEAFSRALSDIPSADRGDKEALKKFQSQHGASASGLVSHWSGLFSALDSRAGAARAPRVHEEQTFQNVLDRPLPWRVAAIRNNATECLRVLELEWGPAPEDIAAIGKRSLFRPPSGILRQGAIHTARAKSLEQAREIQALFDAQAAKSALAISYASLPKELSSLLLKGRPETIAMSSSPAHRPQDPCEAREYDKALAQAIRRAQEGKAFVLSHPVAFGWGAFALSLGAPAAAVKAALPPGGLARAAHQIETLFDKTRWHPSVKAIIEQDALELCARAQPAAARPSARL